MAKLKKAQLYFEHLIEMYPEELSLKEHVNYLFERAEKADRYEDLALKHQYQTIVNEIEF